MSTEITTGLYNMAYDAASRVGLQVLDYDYGKRIKSASVGSRDQVGSFSVTGYRGDELTVAIWVAYIQVCTCATV